MNHIIYNILIPAIMPILFLNIAATPVEVLGCRNRGLIAFMIALISGLASLSAAIMAIRGRMRNDLDTIRWIITSLILVIPVIALIILA
jgi:hypothetical protein